MIYVLGHQDVWGILGAWKIDLDFIAVPIVVESCGAVRAKRLADVEVGNVSRSRFDFLGWRSRVFFM